MGYPINKPEHPVIDRDPPVSKIFAAFRAQDWSNVALLTGVSLPFGYIAGRPLLMRPSMYVAGTLSAMAGILLGAQSSFARLTGYKENAVEVAKYHSPATATVEPNSSS